MAKNCRFAVAVHVAAVLAMNRDHPATSDWLAGSVNTNPVVVRRILSALAKAGLVVSQRGTTGGSLLGCEPKTVSLLDILRAVDGDDEPSTHHSPPNPACPVGANILPVLIDFMHRAEQAKRDALARISLQDVVDGIQVRLADHGLTGAHCAPDLGRCLPA